MVRPRNAEPERSKRKALSKATAEGTSRERRRRAWQEAMRPRRMQRGPLARVHALRDRSGASLHAPSEMFDRLSYFVSSEWSHKQDLPSV